MTFLHVTFKEPLPRVVLNERPTPVVAATVEGDLAISDYMQARNNDAFVQMLTRWLIVVADASGKKSAVKMRIALHVHTDHIVSVVECKEPA